jgi:hypothetical protein
LFTKKFPFLEGGKIQKAKIHRFLHLINIISCQEKEGDMGLNKFDGSGAVWIYFRVEKSFPER